MGDVVWVIRNFRPDVIITRFPITGEGGHGHHTASAILANEAFIAAADPKKFTNQLKYVKPWQAKRILWNTFNFGGNNTTDANQFHFNVGEYNSLLGKSYGEIAAQSRSQHKSQGFGSAPSYGDTFEYFKTTGGDAPKNNLVDDVDISWSRIGKSGASIDKMIDQIKQNFDESATQKSVPSLVALYSAIEKLGNNYWAEKKLEEVQQLIQQCSGLHLDFFSKQSYAIQTEKLELNALINNRLGVQANVKSISFDNNNSMVNEVLQKNKNFNFSKTIEVPLSKEISQPYWLKEKMEDNAYTVNDLLLIGKPDVQPSYKAKVVINIEGKDFVFEKPVQYKYTDPVKGEVYQPLCVVPPATVTTSPHLLIFSNEQNRNQKLQMLFHANANIKGELNAGLTGIDFSGVKKENTNLEKGKSKVYEFSVSDHHKPTEVFSVSAYANSSLNKDTAGYYLALRFIDYEHIPAIRYFYPDFVTALNIDLKTAGKKVGYIPGAGDKVAAVLERMGYSVTILDKANIASANLNEFDAIITGVRAYNTNEWMNEVYDNLMNYVKEGGNLIVQYNTNNFIGKVSSKIGPYSFTIGRNRITDETAKVTILDPNHKLFNFPNKINKEDFDGWVQERSIYHASNWDSNFKPLLAMADPGEKNDEGSLITAQYGKGYFTYTGLVFYRELPAAVPGAIRLMANLIGLNKEEK